MQHAIRLTVAMSVFAVALTGLPHSADAQTNTATGTNALSSNTTGVNGSAFGYDALQFNTSGSQNTGVGAFALQSNGTGHDNVAVGVSAGWDVTSGAWNTAIGNYALETNSTGNSNVAVGYGTLDANTGSYNTAVGLQALQSNTSGTNNIAVGISAGSSCTTGSYNIDIGNVGAAGEGNTIRIGNSNQTAAYVAGISGKTSSGGIAVLVNSSGKLGTTTSSARFKDDIESMGNSTSGLMSLRPVRFRYKKDIDPSGLEQYGLVAEEVAKVYPDLVVYDDDGRPEAVRYHFVNAMLLNEFQKQTRRLETQDRTLKAQARKIEALTAQVTEASAQAEEIRALTTRLTQLEATIGTGEARTLEAAYQPEPRL